MRTKSTKFILFTPFLIIGINSLVAILFGKLIGKWAFIPLIIIEWGLFLYFILKYSPKGTIKEWLKKPQGKWGWSFVALLIGLIPLPIFLKFHYLLDDWTIWLPWIILALFNPFIEEFYWRGFLMDTTKKWNKISSILFTSVLFSANHAVFGINSELFRGYEVIISTFIMGIVWAITYHKTNSLRWVILSHFLVDFLNLSAPAFLDLFKPHF